MEAELITFSTTDPLHTIQNATIAGRKDTGLETAHPTHLLKYRFASTVAKIAIIQIAVHTTQSQKNKHEKEELHTINGQSEEKNEQPPLQT